jgi:hypothetical protein
MLRTSRCFAGTLLQLGGPDALSSVVRYPYQFRFADFSFARIAPCPGTTFLFAARAEASVLAKIGKVICKSKPKLFAIARRANLFAAAGRSTPRNLGGNRAMQLVAIG